MRLDAAGECSEASCAEDSARQWAGPLGYFSQLSGSQPAEGTPGTGLETAGRPARLQETAPA